jgi:tetratricopeptide (TPR) repeat protein
VWALADRLADEQHRLDELELSDIGTRASLDVSLRELSASGDPIDRAAAAAFPLLGVPDGPDLGVPVVARLLDHTEPETEPLLERLVDAQLLESPSPGRYRLHDLLRLYARDHATRQHPSLDLAAALDRTLHFYVATAWHTHALLRPGDQRLAKVERRWTRDGLQFQDLAGALAWLEAERTNLVAAVGQAAARDNQRAAAVQLAQALFAFLWLRSYWQDCIQINQTALSVAGQVGDRAAEGQATNDLGGVYWLQGHYAEAVASLQESLAVARELGDRYGEGNCLANFGLVHGWQGRDAQAVACLQESLDIFRELGDRRGEGISLDDLGSVHWRGGRDDQAVACHLEALAIHREVGDRHSQGNTLNNLGHVYGRQGRFDQAVACLQESLDVFRELGDPHGEAECLVYLGRTHARQEQQAGALTCFEESAAIFREQGDRFGEADSLSGLGETLNVLGQHQRARSHLQAALAIFEELQTPDAEAVRALLAGAQALGE